MRFTYRQPVTYRASMPGGYGYEGRDIPAEFLRLSDTRKRAIIRIYPNGGNKLFVDVAVHPYNLTAREVAQTPSTPSETAPHPTRGDE